MSTQWFSISSEQGQRSNLEDAAQAFQLELAQPATMVITGFAIADGAGGMEAGEVASSTGLFTICHQVITRLTFLATQCNAATIAPDSIDQVLAQALCAANKAVYQQATSDAALAGMASTAVVAVVMAGNLHIGWVGDSRAYLFSQGRLRLLTRDHTAAEQLIDEGLLSAEDAQDHPATHTLIRYLGQSDNFHPETRHCRVYAGDLVLIASDGLTNVLDDQELADHLELCLLGELPLKTLANQLVQRALEAGTTDNTTAICCQVQPEQASSRQTVTAGYSVKLAETLHLFHKESCHVIDSPQRRRSEGPAGQSGR